jgi:hypothetical protein
VKPVLKALLLIGFFVVVAVALLVALPPKTSSSLTNEMVLIDLTGFSEVQVRTESGVIYLESDQGSLPVYVSASQSQSVRDGLRGLVVGRPTVHDTFSDTLDFYGVQVLSARIVDLQKNTFLAKLTLRKDNKILSIDCKPSDAIGVAVRNQAPVYVRDSLLERNQSNG